MAKQKKRENGGDNVDERRLKIVLEALKNQGLVEFDQVRELYKDNVSPEGLFGNDARQLINTLKAAEKFLLPLGFPVPKIVFKGKTISIPVREFAKLLHPDDIGSKRRFAKALIEKKHEDEYLIPRSGNLYLGIGATMYELTNEIIERRDQFEKDLNVYTQNFELAVLLNLAAPKNTERGRFSLEFPGWKVDFNSGSIVAANLPQFIDVAVIGVHRIRKEGIFTQTPDALATTIEYLRLADKIIVFATEVALKMRAGQTEIKLPTDKKVLFVTNQDFPAQLCPSSAEHVVINTRDELVDTRNDD